MSIETRDPASTGLSAYWRLYVPKSVTVLREGYDLKRFSRDAIAGLTVAIVALPLSLAIAIASGVGPERGLYTAIIAGFLISALGGSRFQIGGPTGAFVVVVFNVVQAHGYDGLVLATAMASVMLLAAGYLQIGTYIKYIPHTVVTGFTAGIAVIIATSQIGEVLGLSLKDPPADFIGKWQAYWAALPGLDMRTALIAAGSLLLILVLRAYRPAWPGFLLAIVAAAAAVWALDWPVPTIAGRFGELPRTLPWPAIPEAATWPRLYELLPSAFTIAFLAGVESLLSAVVADGMTGRRHRSNCELVAQGAANMGSIFFGGIPATGAIARTATNIRAGAYSPVSGMLHALFIAIIMLLFAPLAGFIPLATLGAVLLIVAWNMAELRNVRHLMSAPMSERAVLLVTFALTVLVDLTVAIEVGVVMAAFVFMHRMANLVELTTDAKLIEQDEDDFAGGTRPVYGSQTTHGGDVEVYQINGPFFFGAASRLMDELDSQRRSPRVIVLRMGRVPMIDASGASALERFIASAGSKGTRVILSNLRAPVRQVLDRLEITTGPNAVPVTKNLEKALLEAGTSSVPRQPPPV